MNDNISHPKDTVELSEVMTASEVAKFLRVHKELVLSEFHDGNLPGRRIGKKNIRFHRSSVLKYLKGVSAENCSSRRSQ